MDAIASQIASLVDQRVAPLEDQMLTRGLEDLLADHPELQNEEAQKALLARAQEISEDAGLQPANMPAFLRHVHELGNPAQAGRPAEDILQVLDDAATGGRRAALPFP